EGHFQATGTLSATCTGPTSAKADMAVSVTLTPFARPGGGLPPALGNPTQTMTWSVLCPAPPNLGPFLFTVHLPPQLQVGDRYSFTIDWTNNTGADSFAATAGVG